MYFDVMVIFYERKNSETYTISHSLQDQPIPYSGHQHAYQHTLQKSQNSSKESVQTSSQIHIQISSHRNNIIYSLTPRFLFVNCQYMNMKPFYLLRSCFLFYFGCKIACIFVHYSTEQVYEHHH